MIKERLYPLTVESEKLVNEYARKAGKNPEEALNDVITISLSGLQKEDVKKDSDSQTTIGGVPVGDAINNAVKGFRSIKSLSLNYIENSLKLEIEFESKKMTEKENKK